MFKSTRGRLSNSLCEHLYFPRTESHVNKMRSTSYEVNLFNHVLFRNDFSFSFRLHGKIDDVIANESISYSSHMYYINCFMHIISKYCFPPKLNMRIPPFSYQENM